MADLQSTIYIATYRSKDDFTPYLPSGSPANPSQGGQHQLWYLKLTLRLVSQKPQGEAQETTDRWEKEASEFIDSLENVRPGRLLYTHGFNNTPDSVIQRAAQLKRDLAPESDVVAFVWNTSNTAKSAQPFKLQALLESYDKDEEELPKAEAVLWNVLKELPHGLTRVLGHSMGCRLVSLCLYSNKSDAKVCQPLHIILAAADVSVDDFLEKYKDALLEFGDASFKPKLYSNRYDPALLVSEKKSHRDGGRGPRVGQTPDTNKEMEELSKALAKDFELISCTGAALKYPDPPQVQKEYWAVNHRTFCPDLHGYYATSPLVLADVRAALQGTPAEQRKTVEKYPYHFWESPVGDWWRVKY